MTSSLSETAFLVNWARSSDSELSRDRWAHLWVTEEARRYGEDFVARVSPWEQKLDCLRNRYFTENLLAFEKQHRRFVFLNIAAGFTSYPYVIDAKQPAIEIDLPHVIEYKQQKMKEFVQKGKLPIRDINFFSLDLNAHDTSRQLEKIIQRFSDKGPFFVLLEGILYYLRKDVVDALFDLMGMVLPSGSRMGVIAWSRKVKNAKAMKVMVEYFQRTLGLSPQEYTWLDHNYFEKLVGFQLVEHANYPELERRFCSTLSGWKREDLIDEDFYVLKRV